jgi:hypothetical protein
MSGAFAMPHSLTGGAGYKANTTYDEFLRKHSSFYRKHSSAGQAFEEDRRRSSIVNDDAAQAVANHEAQNPRKSSIVAAHGGAATANTRKGSVVVASTADRRDSIFGMEASAGSNMNPDRRNSTSLASDLLHKFKDRKGSK